MSMAITEVKNIFEMNQEELMEYNHQKLLEFKELFLTTDLPVDEIFNKIRVSKGDVTYRFIQNSRKSEGLSAKNREVNFKIKEQSNEERFAEHEEFYQQFKELWLADPNISKKAIYAKLGKTQQKERVQYVNNRMEEDNLPPHNFNRRNHVKTPLQKDKEEIYQEYKKLFETTTIPLKEVREQLNIPHQTNATLRKYILSRSREDGLDGRKRNIKQQREKNPRVKQPKETKSKPKKEVKHRYSIQKESQYSSKAHQMIKDSKPLLEKLYSERNISRSTQKGYEASFIKYCDFTKDKFNNLQEMLDFYLAEEDKRIPMRERSLKKDLLGFREYLLDRSNGGNV